MDTFIKLDFGKKEYGINKPPGWGKSFNCFETGVGGSSSIV